MLVVDDEKDVIDYITIVLESAGFEVISSESGSNCFKLVESERPDLIILDVMMETITEGFIIGDELKYNSKYHSIPIILLSGIENNIGFPINKSSIPGDDYIEKPVNPHDLLEAIKKFLK